MLRRPAHHGWLDVGLVGLALVVDLALWGGDSTLRGGQGSVPPSVVLVLALAVFGSLTQRNRWPRGVYVVAWVYTVACASAMPMYEPFTAVLLALHHIGRHLTLRQGLPFLVATAVPWAVNTFNAVALIDASPSEAAGIAAGWCALTSVVWVTGRFGYRADETAALRERNREARAALAVQEERLRLARELHDSVANSVTAVIMQAAGGRHTAAGANPELANVLAAIEDSGTRAMHELRRLLGLLHTSAPEDEISTGSSLEDLDRLLDTTRACSVSVQKSEEGHRVPLDPRIDHAAYRIVQEGLGNAVKHGGSGCEAAVNLSWSPAELTISVRSVAGPARPVTPSRTRVGPGTTGLGLNGLKRRVALLGGSFDADFAPDSSFVLSAHLPLQARQENVPGQVD